MATKEFIIRNRRGDLSDFTTENPILDLAELCVVFERDVDGKITSTKLKAGDGLTRFNNLDFIDADSSSGLTAIQIRDLLETLTGDDRLNANAIKDLQSQLTALNVLRTPSHTSIPDGTILIKQGDTLTPSSLIEKDGEIESTKPIKTTPTTLWLGDNLGLHENGGFLEEGVEISNKRYLVLDYENDPNTGTKKPIYYKRGVLTDHVMQGVSNVVMNNVTTFSEPIFNQERETSSVSFKLNDDVSNLRMAIKTNGKYSGYYPSKNAWNGNEIGYNLPKGDFTIPLNPHYSVLTGYALEIEFKADNRIDLLGNGTYPYMSISYQPITRINMATMDDIPDAYGIEDVLKENNDANGQVLNNIGQIEIAPVNGHEWKANTDDDGSFRVRDESDSVFFNVNPNGRITTPTFDSDSIPVGGINKFIQLTDTPSAYDGKSGYFVKVNSAENALEFDEVSSSETPESIITKITSKQGQSDALSYNVLKDKPSITESDSIHFRHAFGVMAMNKTGQTISANTFVMLSPKANGKYNMQPITKDMGYHGEMFGLLEIETVNDAENTVNLIDNMQTGATGVSEGMPCYVGFSSEGEDNNIGIEQTGYLVSEFGKCGVFGGQNSIGEYMASFNCFQVQADYLIQQHHDKDIEYYDSLPAVIGKNALFVYLFENIISEDGIVEQRLPLLAEVQNGMQIIVENQSASENAKIRLTAMGVDKIEGSSTYDVSGGNHKVILIATKDGWVKFFDSLIHGGEDLSAQVATNTANISKNTKEIERLKTDISTGGLDTYVWRDKGVPTIPTDKQYKAYYIHSIVLKDSSQILAIPNNTPDGAIFSVENNDRTDYLTISPPNGETINGSSSSYQAGYDTLNYFVKDGTDWILAYGGVFPNNYSVMKTTIQTLFPNSLHTLAEVEAQLKDRLHTFREIQNEFTPQLHTYTQLQEQGFSREYVEIGYSSSNGIPSDNNWIKASGGIDTSVRFDDILVFPSYVIIRMEEDTFNLVEDIKVNNVLINYTQSDSDGYIYLISPTTIPVSNIAVTMSRKTIDTGNGITFDDGTNNVANVETVNIKGGMISNIQSKEIDLNVGVIGKDDDSREFSVSKIQSLDGKIRVSNLGSGIMDLDADYNTVTDGIFAKLGNDEDINTDFHDQRPYFSDIYDNTGRYVGIDFNHKAFTIQEGDILDPNITGGSTFNIGMYFEPIDYNIASDDGYIELKVVELSLADGSVQGYLNDIDGNPVAIRREYKGGQTIGKELLLGVVRAKAQRRIAFEIDVQFGSQILRASSHTAVYIQETDKEHTSGVCELLFQQHTGYRILKTSRYYGVNNMNLASTLVKNKPQQTLNNTNELMGDGIFFDTRNQCKVDITDYHITIQDDGVNLPVFSLGKIWDEFDTQELRLKTLNAKVVITDKKNAFRYALMKWTGTGQATLPVLTGYNNLQPVFASGWVKVADKFISEDVVSGDHINTNAFTVPDDAKQIAMIIYPADSQNQTVMKLKDFEVDVSPAITKTVIQSTFHVSEEHLIRQKWMYKSVVATPSGLSGYRYTTNLAETKLPVGVIKGGDGKIVNANNWHDSGSSDPNKVQGDLKFLIGGDADVEFSCQIGNETATENDVTFWLGKSNGDGTFSEVTGSEYQSKIPAHQAPNFKINHKFVIKDIKEEDEYRFFGQSNIDDGFYLQSGTNGVPMVEFIIDFNELEEKEQDILDRLDTLELSSEEIIFVDGDGHEVHDKRLQYNTATGQMKVVDR